MGWPISASMQVRWKIRIFIDFIKLPLLSGISSWTLICIDKEALWCGMVEFADAIAVLMGLPALRFDLSSFIRVTLGSII